MTTTESRHPGGQNGQKDGGVGTTVVLDTCVLLADPLHLMYLANFHVDPFTSFPERRDACPPRASENVVNELLKVLR